MGGGLHHHFVFPDHIYVMVKAAAEELAPTIHDLRRKGYSYREIAQTLGVSTKLVYNVLHSTPDAGDTGGNTPETLETLRKHLKTPRNVSETLGNSGGKRETPGNAPLHSGGWKHSGNSGKQLETHGNSGNSGGSVADTPTRVGDGDTPRVVKEEEGESVLGRERVEHLEREVAYLRGLVDRLTEAVQRQTEALAREQTIVHELQAKLEPPTIPQPKPTTTPSGGETPRRRPWWRFW